MEVVPRRSRNAPRIILEPEYTKPRRNVRHARKPRKGGTGKGNKYGKTTRTRLRGPLSDNNSHYQSAKHAQLTLTDDNPDDPMFNQMNRDEESSESDTSSDDDYDVWEDSSSSAIALRRKARENELEHMDYLLGLIEGKADDNVVKCKELWHNNVVNPLAHDQHYVYPWVDLLMPGYSQPYCTNVELISQNTVNHDSKCLFSYLITEDNTSNNKLLYLTIRQMYLIIDNIMNQVLKTDDERPVLIDWIEVSRISNVSENVCKEFWWNFDKTHIRDVCDGCVFSVNCRHYYEVDEAYYVDLRNRVRQLLHLTKQSREEQKKIFSSCNDTNA